MMFYIRTYVRMCHHNQSNPVEECNSPPNELLKEGSIWSIYVRIYMYVCELREAARTFSLEVVCC